MFFFQSHKCQKYADMCACNTQLMSPSTRQLGLFQMTHLSHQVINICAYVSTSAAVIGLLRLFFPSQPQGGAVDLGGPGLCWLALHAPSFTGQTFVDLRGHGKERPLHIIRAFRTSLQARDLQGRSQVLWMGSSLIKSSKCVNTTV